MVSLIAGLKIKGIVKWRGLKLEGPLYVVVAITKSWFGLAGKRDCLIVCHIMRG